MIPRREFFDCENNEVRDSVHKILSSVGYLISPYYNGLIRTNAPGGFYHIDEIAPDEFRQSEYFDVYYGRKNVADEGMFLCPLDDVTTFVFMIERTKDEQPFTSDNIAHLRLLFPIVSALITRHVKIAGLGDALSAENRENRSAFHVVAERFGAEFFFRPRTGRCDADFAGSFLKISCAGA